MKKQIINKFGPKKVILEKTATRTHIMYCFIFPFLSHSVWQLSILFKIVRLINLVVYANIFFKDLFLYVWWIKKSLNFLSVLASHFPPNLSLITPANFRVCDRQKFLAKQFKICHILYIRNPRVAYSISHFVLLYIFT